MVFLEYVLFFGTTNIDEPQDIVNGFAFFSVQICIPFTIVHSFTATDRNFGCLSLN